MIFFETECYVVQILLMLVLVCWNWVGVFSWLLPSLKSTLTFSGGTGKDRAVEYLPGTHQMFMLFFAIEFYVIGNPMMLQRWCA